MAAISAPTMVSKHGVSSSRAVQRQARRVVPQALARHQLPQRNVVRRAAEIRTGTDAKLSSEKETDQEALKAMLLKLKGENMELKAKLAEIQAQREARFEAKEKKDEKDEDEALTVPMESPLAGLTPTEIIKKLESGIVWPKATEDAFWNRAPRTVELPVGAGDYRKPPEKDGNSMHVVHIAAELAPYAKVGGLGDVVTGLAKACTERGHFCEVMLPYYSCLPEDAIENKKLEAEIQVPKGYHWDGEMRVGTQKVNVFSGVIDGVNVLLVQPDPETSNIFKCDRIYGGSYNEIEAYLHFCRATLEFLKQTNRNPNVLHLHEWQTSAAALLYWDVYHQQGMPKPRVMLTIHSMANSGEVRQDEFLATGFPGESFATIEKALDERTIGHNPERLNMLKGAIRYSNAVTTVSPTYAEECLNGDAAGFLRTLFNQNDIKSKFHGVLNGIDTEEWDPSMDDMLPATYSPNFPMGKAMCKKYLQQGLGLTVDPNKPLVACVSRLVPQKGIHLIRHSIHRTVEQGGQFVLLGSGHADGDFRHMAEGEFKNHSEAALKIMYSERLAHLIYAAADIVVVPSMFEPCGLTQLIAIRYGALPLVRRTGGLADTVHDVDAVSDDKGNGFVFDGSDEGSMNSALDRAIEYYKEKPEWWAERSIKNMESECGWRDSAKQYVQLYNSISC